MHYRIRRRSIADVPTGHVPARRNLSTGDAKTVSRGGKEGHTRVGRHGTLSR
ncbi:MAG: hypothetical protein II170_06325 [Bacteroidaceae bacterium]|nr:hypothetical protein [Bacteroidaceae bacterium]MBQ4002339.1 hypothetical protein [Bacteroidaceae bacterium]